MHGPLTLESLRAAARQIEAARPRPQMLVIPGAVHGRNQAARRRRTVRAPNGARLVLPEGSNPFLWRLTNGAAGMATPRGRLEVEQDRLDALRYTLGPGLELRESAWLEPDQGFLLETPPEPAIVRWRHPSLLSLRSWP